MNNKGFIATSILYTFFMVFCILLLGLVASFLHNRVLLFNIIDDVKGNLVNGTSVDRNMRLNCVTTDITTGSCITIKQGDYVRMQLTTTVDFGSTTVPQANCGAAPLTPCTIPSDLWIVTTVGNTDRNPTSGAIINANGNMATATMISAEIYYTSHRYRTNTLTNTPNDNRLNVNGELASFIAGRSVLSNIRIPTITELNSFNCQTIPADLSSTNPDQQLQAMVRRNILGVVSIPFGTTSSPWANRPPGSTTPITNNPLDVTNNVVSGVTHRRSGEFLYFNTSGQSGLYRCQCITRTVPAAGDCEIVSPLFATGANGIGASALLPRPIRPLVNINTSQRVVGGSGSAADPYNIVWGV